MSNKNLNLIKDEINSNGFSLETFYHAKRNEWSAVVIKINNKRFIDFSTYGGTENEAIIKAYEFLIFKKWNITS